MNSQDIDSLYEDAAAEAVVEIDASDSVLNPLLVEFRTMRDRKDVLEDELKVINKAINDPGGLQERILKILEARGVTSIRKDGVGLVSVAVSLWPKVLDRERMISWLDENGHDSIAPRTVNAQTLRSWVREQKENNGPLPPPEVMDDNSGNILKLRRS